jgi:Flp pilus assembly pilin Flp
MRVWQFWSDDSGANMVEYALLVALIGIACVGTIFPGIRDGVASIFNAAGNPLNAAS